jgi:hypothetical protein
MRPFAQKVLLFVSPIILGFLLLEIFLRTMGTSYKIKEQQLLQSHKNIQVLILGNSHAAYGIDPAKFSNPAFNLAQVSQSLYYDRRITEKYIDEMKKLKYVLISIDFHSLYFSDEGYRNMWTYYGYGVNPEWKVPVLPWCSYAIGYQPKFSIEFLKRFFSGKYANFKALDVETGVDLSRPIRNGFFAYKDSTDLQESSLKKRAEEFNQIVRHKEERISAIKDLETFITNLQARGITPILVTLPCYGPYRELLDKNVQAQNEIDIRYLSEKYKIGHWDYFALDLQPDYFFNCDHLNGKGAAYVSSLLNERLLSKKADR